MCSHIGILSYLGDIQAVYLVTSSNHVKIVAIHEASRECVVEVHNTSHSRKMWFEM